MLLKATDPKDADIIWTGSQVDEDLKKAVGITKHHLVNQFPFEACIVMKHHLAETIQKVRDHNGHNIIFHIFIDLVVVSVELEDIFCKDSTSQPFFI